MKLLAIILQNNRGENIAIVSCSTMHLAEVSKYASIVHHFILESYSTNSRFSRE